MSEKKQIATKNVLNRLNKVAFHFEERAKIFQKLNFFTNADREINSSKHLDLNNILVQIKKMENDFFSEIVHLKQDLDKYFDLFLLKKSELKMLSEFKPYQIAEQQLTKALYDKHYYLISKTQGNNPSHLDPIIAYILLFEYKGSVYLSIDLILDLITIFDIFLINHTDIDANIFEQKIIEVRNRKSIATSPVPHNLHNFLQHTEFNNKKKSHNQDSHKFIEKDILDRLSEIALLYEEQDNLFKALKNYTEADTNPSSPKNKDVERLKKLIEINGTHTLYELVHLKDNLEDYIRIIGGDIKELCVVEEFKSYRIAQNFVNSHKHGTRGKNAKTTKIDYTSYIFKGSGDKPSPNDHISQILPIINYEGDVVPITEIILDLIIIWKLFLKNHTNINIESFKNRIEFVRVRNQGNSNYIIPIPKGWRDDAKRLVAERKKLDI